MQGQSATERVSAAFERGRKRKMEQDREEQLQESRKLEQDILRHRIKAIDLQNKIEPQLKARQLQEQNYRMRQGTPGEPTNIPQSMRDVLMQNTARVKEAQIPGGLPPQEFDVPTPGNPAQQFQHPEMDISGVEGVEGFPDVPGMSLRPQTEEQVQQKSMAAMLNKIQMEAMGKRMEESSKLHNLSNGSKLVNAAGKTVAEGGPKEGPASFQEFERAKADGFKGTYNDYQNMDANRKRPVINTLTQDNRLNTRVDRQVSQFKDEPIVKKYSKVADALQFAKSLDVNSKNPADDQALIYAFAKAMDPDSAVREGEYATIQKYSQSWLESFGFNAKRVLLNQEFLTPEARTNLVKTITQRAAPVITQYQKLHSYYSGRINKITGRKDGVDDLPDYGAEPSGVSVTAPNGQVYTFPDQEKADAFKKAAGIK